LEQRGELRPALASRQRQPQCLQVAADSLQLADELAGGVVIEAVARPLAKLLEALERRPRVGRQLGLLGFQDLPGKLAGLIEVPGAAENGYELDRRCRGLRELFVRHLRDRLDRQPPDSRQVVVDIVLWYPELLEVGPDRGCRNPLFAQRGDSRTRRPLRKLASVLAEDQPVVNVLRRRRSQRLGKPPVPLLVRPVIVA